MKESKDGHLWRQSRQGDRARGALEVLRQALWPGHGRVQGRDRQALARGEARAGRRRGA